MANFFAKLWKFIKTIFTRPGLDSFLRENIALAREIVMDLSEVHSGADFHEWKDEAWRLIQARTGELRGNWISLLLGFAFEELKAKLGAK